MLHLQIGREKTFLFRLTPDGSSVFPKVAHFPAIAGPDANGAGSQLAVRSTTSLAGRLDSIKAERIVCKNAMKIKKLEEERMLQEHGEDTSEIVADLGVPSPLVWRRPSSSTFTELAFTLPLPGLVQHVLTGASEVFRAKLRHKWSERQKIYRHVLMDPIGIIPKEIQRASLCNIAGMCLHDLPLLAGFECAFVVKLAELFRPKTLERHLLVHGCIVFALHTEISEHWYHCSYSNLAAGSWRFSLLPLTVVDDADKQHSVAPGIALSVGSDASWAMTWHAFSSIVLDVACSLEVFRIYGTKVAELSFQPGTLQVRRMTPKAVFWHGEVAVRPALPPGDRPRRGRRAAAAHEGALLMDALADVRAVAVDEGDQDGGGHEFADMFADMVEAEGFEEFDSEPEADDPPAYPAADVEPPPFDEEPEEPLIADVEPPPFDEEAAEPLIADVEPPPFNEEPPAVVDHGVPDGDGPGPVIVHAVPPPPAAGPGWHARGGPAWPRYDIEGFGHLVHDQGVGGRNESVAAHCARHGALCRVNRALVRRKGPAGEAGGRCEAQGRPVGFLIAWLKAADLPEFSTKAQHRELASSIFADHDAISFDRRVEARTLAEGFAHLQPLLDRERPRHPAEGPEPILLA